MKKKKKEFNKTSNTKETVLKLLACQLLKNGNPLQKSAAQGYLDACAQHKKAQEEARYWHREIRKSLKRD